ncbi:hypothetical protein ABDK00_001485 [Niabella insulamsoli]|uniref:hypothetical protein n=1 Tax=Niabella insulamsoli TaxID=3144874 RepID=UPI0031FDA878
MAYLVTIECPNHIVANAIGILFENDCMQKLINTELDRIGLSEHKIDIDKGVHIDFDGEDYYSDHKVNLNV